MWYVDEQQTMCFPASAWSPPGRLCHAHRLPALLFTSLSPLLLATTQILRHNWQSSHFVLACLLFALVVRTRSKRGQVVARAPLVLVTTFFLTLNVSNFVCWKTDGRHRVGYDQQRHQSTQPTPFLSLTHSIQVPVSICLNYKGHLVIGAR